MNCPKCGCPMKPGENGDWYCENPKCPYYEEK